MSRKEDYERMDTNKYLNLNLKTDGLPLPDVNAQFIEFFHRMDYKWWRDVEEGDVVVDIGACVGFFVCHALDRKASRIFAIEPSRPHLKTLIQNISDHYIDNSTTPVIPIEAGIGSTSNHFNNVFSEYREFKRMSFLDLVVDYNIPKIDYLKIDCEGGEYDILTEENFDWIYNNVGHIAVEVHRRHAESGNRDMIKFRNEFLKKYEDEGRLRYQNEKLRKGMWNDELILASDWWNLPSEFMAYFIKK